MSVSSKSLCRPNETHSHKDTVIKPISLKPELYSRYFILIKGDTTAMELYKRKKFMKMNKRERKEFVNYIVCWIGFAVVAFLALFIL